MRQELTAIHVANGINITIAAYTAVVIIYQNRAIGSCGDASCSHIQSLCIRLASCSNQDDVGIDICDSLYSSLHFKLNTSFLKKLTQTFGNIAVQHGQTLLQELDDLHLRAKALENRGKLHPDDTSTDDT